MDINFKEISCIPFCIIIFHKALIKFRNILNPFKVIYRQLSSHFAAIQFIYIQIFKIWRFFIFIIIFHVFVISFNISINGMTYSTSDTFLSIYNITISVKRASFTLVFFASCLICQYRCSKKTSRVKFIYFKTHILKVFKYIS